MDDKRSDGEVAGDRHGRLPPSRTLGPLGRRSRIKARRRIPHPRATKTGVTSCVKVKNPMPHVGLTYPHA